KHDTAAGLLSKRPEYLRIFDRNSAQQIQGSAAAAALLEQPDAPAADADDPPPPPPPPLSARSLASAGSSALATTNHLLLSGVNTEFDPALVFRRPSSSSLLPASPDAAAAAAALMFQPMFSPAALEEEAEEGEDGPHRPHSNTGATQSDSLSFRTALSDLSEEALSGEDLSEEDLSEKEEEKEGKNDALWRASSCASSHDGGVGQAAHARASACLHGSSLAQLLARGRAAPPPPPQVAAFHASPPGAGLVSPQSQRSVPVAEQARRARHPVYRLGALANATFEGGRHQDAFDLYSWALQLLSPAAGTTAQEMLATAAAAAATATPADKDGGCDGARRRASAGDRPRAWRQALSPASSTASVSVSASASASAPVSASASSATAGDEPRGRSSVRAWLSFGRAAKPKPKQRPAVVVDEPLPAAVLAPQPRAGQYAFSAAMLRQLVPHADEEEAKEEAEEETKDEEEEESEKNDADAWFMGAGDERTDVCALLLSNRSAAAFALGKYAAAARDAARAIELRGAWGKAHFRRGEALLALGRVRDAYAAYRRALALEPHDAHVRVSCERARILAQNEAMGLRV
ncbi:hypothetical protein GGI00_004899, partial [Coemansia sp. RSA 2681]